MSSWYSGKLLANGITIAYTRTGGDRPPVILAHGFAENGRCWTRFAKALEADYDVTMYDARGHGRSSAPESGYTSEERVADLAGLIRGLALERPALIGHSMGAATVAMLAAWRSDLARCIVLEDPPWGPPSPPRTAEETHAALRGTQAGLTRNKRRSREELITRLRQRHPDWDESELGPAAEARQELSPNIIKILEAPGIPWQEVIGRITCPILVLLGDAEQGGIVTTQQADEMAGLWSNGRIVHIAGAGHNIRRERFGAFCRAVKKFLEEEGAGRR